MLTYEILNKENFNIANEVLKKIFPDDDCDETYKIALTNPSYGTFVLVRYNDVPCGVTGFYDNDYKGTDAFMGWFGVLPGFRMKGLGSEIFDWTVNMVEELGFNYFRLYTDIEMNDKAVKFYTKKNMIKESFYNSKNKIGANGKTVIFTLPLNKQKKVELWENRYLDEG